MDERKGFGGRRGTGEVEEEDEEEEAEGAWRLCVHVCMRVCACV